MGSHLTSSSGPVVESHPPSLQEIGLFIRPYLWFAVPKPISREVLYRNHLISASQRPLHTYGTCFYRGKLRQRRVRKWPAEIQTEIDRIISMIRSSMLSAYYVLGRGLAGDKTMGFLKTV